MLNNYHIDSGGVNKMHYKGLWTKKMYSRELD